MVLPAVALGVLGSIIAAVPILTMLTGPKKQSVKGQHVMITGGSQGIGLSMAVMAARQGAKVSIVARDMKKLLAAKETIEKAAPDAQVIVLSIDLTNAAATKKGVEEGVKALGDIKFLFCNAGYSIPGRFEEMDVSLYKKMMDTNYFGAVNSIKAALPSLKAAGPESRIVLTSSMAGVVALFGYTAYSPSKAAINALAESLRYELLASGVRVSVAFPPDTKTPGFEVENETKPEETVAMGDGSGCFTADEVAAVMLNKAQAGWDRINVGMDGFLLGIVTAGMTPQPIFWHKILDVMFMPILRIAAFVYVASWNSTVLKIAAKKNK